MKAADRNVWCICEYCTLYRYKQEIDRRMNEDGVDSSEAARLVKEEGFKND